MNETLDSLLAADEPAPIMVHNENGQSPFLIVVDHAGNSMPRSLAADTAYGTGKFLAWIIGKRITYRYGVAGSGINVVLRFQSSIRSI